MSQPIIRLAAVAGMFYPNDAGILTADVRRFLAQAQTERAGHTAPTGWPKAIIAPHAGYIYSGPVAATAYSHLAPARGHIDRVILLGPCHRVAVNGLALSSADRFQTPLGDIELDKTAEAQIASLPQIVVSDAAHKDEHSLEVHLPFLQFVLGKFKLVPMVVGQASTGQVAEVLQRLWGGPETLIVISSDLSHYLDYASAQTIDASTSRAIETFTPDAIHDAQACGRIPIKGLLQIAHKKGLRVETVDVRNSGDTEGSKTHVVGYGSWIFTEPGKPQITAPTAKQNFETQTTALLTTHGRTLLTLAARSIANGLNHGSPWAPRIDQYPKDLHAKGACFVTLKRRGNLRGCIGSLEAYRPLALDVTENAYATAFNDTRFAKLTWKETQGLDLSVSVLSPAIEMNFADENDLLDQLRPGVDGLIIRDLGRRALFLPQVWKDLPNRREFLEHLKLKGGFTRDHWTDTFQAFQFISESVAASDLLDDLKSLWSPYRNA